jgi:hypothetical protein
LQVRALPAAKLFVHPWRTRLFVFLRAWAEFDVGSDKRRGDKASFGSVCEAYLSAFSLFLALWLDSNCSASDKVILEKYMAKVQPRSVALVVLLLTACTQVAPKLDRIGQGSQLLELCKLLIPAENSPWLNA